MILYAAGVPGVLSVEPDKNWESENKDYGGKNLQSSTDLSTSGEASETTPTKTKKLFVTGLSFYTSEKTLRAAFEGFGELVEVKIIMDKISKRSKGYAFIEYTTEEAASAALREMNGKATSFLGIRSPVPYTLRKFVKKSKLESGMNFAYGGTGVFDTVFGGPNLTTQIDFFQQLLEQKLYSTKNDVVNSSIALVSVAGNDYAAYFGNHTEDFAVVIKSIIKQLAVDLERIHGLGVRKIAVTAIGPLGCLPRMTSFLSYQNCSEVANLVSIFHNQILRQKVEELNKETKKSSFVILDLYNASLSAIMLPKHHQGYSTLQINPLKPCCVGVSKEYSCGSVDESGAKKYIVCDKPKLIHPSQNGWHELELKIGTNSIYGIIKRGQRTAKDREQSLSCAIKNYKKDRKEQELQVTIKIDGYETSIAPIKQLRG
ncbi:hypothetical protein ACE6H2_006819 [Prunus campanulata]